MKTTSTVCSLSMAVVLQLTVLASSAQITKYVYTGSETNIKLAPGNYVITAYGAQGGDGGGLGAEMSGQFSFSTNTTLTLLFGGQGGIGGGSIIDSSAITNLAEVSGIASPDDSPNGEIIIIEVSSTLLSEPPAIGITTVSNQPVIVWPASATYYVVQMTTNLTSGNWVTITNGIPFIGLQITNAPGTNFFRLVP